MRTRHTRRRSTALVTVVAALLIASGCGRSVAERTLGIEGGDSPELVFVATPSLQPANLQQEYQPILKMLRAETGDEIRLQYATDYAAVITGLRQGRIQIAAMGPLSYVLAKRQGVQITLVAAQAREKAQHPEYHSLGITAVGSPIKTIGDFRGKRICFSAATRPPATCIPPQACSPLVFNPSTTSRQFSLVAMTPRCWQWPTASATLVSRLTA